MIVLKLTGMTGKQVTAIIEKAIRQRTKESKKTATQAEFCRVSGLSKMAINAWKNGTTDPGPEGITKIAVGLQKWEIGFMMEVTRK